MADSSQGGRSSRPGPASEHRERAHRTLRKLDRAISKLDHALWIQEAINPLLASKLRAKRAAYDLKRTYTRRWLKGYED